jgi:hypothetical protein
MPTQAKAKFDQNCGDINRLLEIHTEIAGDTPGRKYGVAVLNKSAVVLICAFWEAYVEDLVAEALDSIIGNTTDFSKLPTDLRKIVAKTVKQDPHELSPWNLAGDGWKVVLTTNLVVAKGKYLGNWNTPKSANIRELFAQALGLPDLPAKWQRAYLTNARAIGKLDAFVTLRGQIAHRGNTLQPVTRAKVEEFRDHIVELISISDNVVNIHVRGITTVPLF